ncbi:molybdopterin-binding protein [Histidinibacterium lentulum]|uniref:Molybdopterin biosynthesis protein n=1 Tax=Histidinibacterium lentulum TaxID=2480588 RepID=A0A3N2QKY3_9RHOB|nr:molybdopterin-binding protein [Histidinibacterium lentulum]ROT95833.1 molybdopterin biosynthesis protein [Histidinibacterium lentulum]
MDFGPVPVADCVGAVLAHSLRQGDLRLKKGRVLTREDAAALAAAGWREVTVARLGPGDLGEDAAAARLAEALVVPGARIRVTRAATGRVNLHAEGPGVARIDRAAIDRVNAVDPMITVATVPEWQRCDDRTMIATVKIIAYGVPERALEFACEAGRGAIGLSETRLERALLIETLVGDAGPGKGAAATEARLARLGAGMDGPLRVAHETEALAEALRAAKAPLVLILTGSATSDPRDVGPEAVRRAGGEVLHVGMPVDPGNLLFLARLGDSPVIGLPGCARSPALNGADRVLERVVCGIPVGPAEIAGMGVGGLLKEIPTRPRPRDHGTEG